MSWSFDKKKMQLRYCKDDTCKPYVVGIKDILDYDKKFDTLENIVGFIIYITRGQKIRNIISTTSTRAAYSQLWAPSVS